eukprot:5511992-Prymnesium_polylepis.1
MYWRPCRRPGCCCRRLSEPSEVLSELSEDCRRCRRAVGAVGAVGAISDRSRAPSHSTTVRGLSEGSCRTVGSCQRLSEGCRRAVGGAVGGLSEGCRRAVGGQSEGCRRELSDCRTRVQ